MQLISDTKHKGPSQLLGRPCIGNIGSHRIAQITPKIMYPIFTSVVAGAGVGPGAVAAGGDAGRDVSGGMVGGGATGGVNGGGCACVIGYRSPPHRLQNLTSSGI